MDCTVSTIGCGRSSASVLGTGGLAFPIGCCIADTSAMELDLTYDSAMRWVAEADLVTAHPTRVHGC